MNINTGFEALRANVTQLAQWTQDAMTDLATQIATGWNMQHDADGHHTDVTATSVTTPVLRLRGGFTTLDLRGGTGGIPLYVQSGVMFVSVITPAVGPLLVYGISQVGQQYGDILFLRRDPTGGSSIQLRDRVAFGAGGVPRGTEIRLESEVSPSYPNFNLTGNSWQMLIYTPGAGTNSLDAWSLLQAVSF